MSQSNESFDMKRNDLQVNEILVFALLSRPYLELHSIMLHSLKSWTYQVSSVLYLGAYRLLWFESVAASALFNSYYKSTTYRSSFEFVCPSCVVFYYSSVTSSVSFILKRRLLGVLYCIFDRF